LRDRTSTTAKPLLNKRQIIDLSNTLLNKPFVENISKKLGKEPLIDFINLVQVGKREHEYQERIDKLVSEIKQFRLREANYLERIRELESLCEHLKVGSQGDTTHQRYSSVSAPTNIQNARSMNFDSSISNPSLQNMIRKDMEDLIGDLYSANSVLKSEKHL
jgi:hypothetical protein